MVYTASDNRPVLPGQKVQNFTSINQLTKDSMIPAEQWQKEYPELTEELILRIQRDAWEQGIRDYIKAGLEMVVRQGGFTDEPEKP